MVGPMELSGTFTKNSGILWDDHNRWGESSVAQVEPYEEIQKRMFGQREHTMLFHTHPIRKNNNPFLKHLATKGIDPSSLDLIHALATGGEVVFVPESHSYTIYIPKVVVPGEKIDAVRDRLLTETTVRTDNGEWWPPSDFTDLLLQFVSFHVEKHSI